MESRLGLDFDVRDAALLEQAAQGFGVRDEVSGVGFPVEVRPLGADRLPEDPVRRLEQPRPPGGHRQSAPRPPRRPPPAGPRPPPPPTPPAAPPPYPAAGRDRRRRPPRRTRPAAAPP